MNQFDIKYNNELDRYARKHKLYISNELKHNQGNHFNVEYDEGIILNYVTVRIKEEIILKLVRRGIISDNELLVNIKEVIRERKLDSIL